MTSGLDDDLALAHRLADVAGMVSLSHFRQELRRWSKSDGSLATNADLAVEDALPEQLRIERPDEAVLGEERGQTGSGDRRWISRAQMKLNVSAARDLASARSYIPPPQWLPDERACRIAEALAAATNPQPAVDHAALQVAADGYDLVIFFTAGPWDLAAPSLVVEEAGGTFTDLAGRTELTNGTAVFSNGYLHDAALRLLSAT